MTTPVRVISRGRPKDPAEVWPVAARFGRVLTGLDSVAVSVTVAHGVADPDAADMVLGAADISGADVVQMIRGGIPGNRYLIRFTAARGAEVHVLAATLDVRTLGA